MIMKATTMAASCFLMATILLGCAHRNDAVDTSFYDNQWSKSGGTKEAWDRDNHECEVERQQRSSSDELKIKNARDLDNDMYDSAMRSGTMYWGGGAHGAMKGAKERQKFYWSQCMEARQWRIADRKLFAAEDNEKDINADINSFKAAKQ
jgi:hypothetical protein